jgi:glycosyltransferase involved in cell wall biosynthesis
MGLGLAEGSTRVIHNGVSHVPGIRERVRQEVSAEPDDLVIAAVGTVEPRKGHIHLLRALSRIKERKPELTWKVVIAGQLREGVEGLERFAEEAGIRTRVHFLGHRNDISDVLAAADIFAMPSLHEGLPVALLEAMMAGLPILASRAGGIPEAITSGEDGLLVPVGEDSALRHELERMLVDRALRQKLAAGAKRRADSSFSRSAMVTAHDNLYRAVLASKE